MFILHISDLHFGIERDSRAKETELAIRNNYMSKLVKKVKEIHSQNPISMILLTGDVAWKATSEDYSEAEMWLRAILDTCGLPMNKLFMCAGNHDLNRSETEDLLFPDEQRKANRLLCVEKLEKLERRFDSYIRFCKNLGVQMYSIGSHKSYLVGMLDTEDVRLICLNTSWYALNNDVKDKMWIGSNFLEVIKNDMKGTDTKPIITIMHHPQTSWNQEERSNYCNNINVFKEICDISDVVVSGHTHETVGTNENIGRAAVLSSGALYQGAYDYNCFYVYHFDFQNPMEEQKRIRYSYINNEWITVDERVKIPHYPKKDRIKYGCQEEIKDKTGNFSKPESNIESQSNLFEIGGKTIRFIPIICSWNHGEDEYYYGDISIRCNTKLFKMPRDIMETFFETQPSNIDIMNNTFERKVRIDDYSVHITGGSRPHQLIFDMSEVSYKDYLIEKLLMDQELCSGETLRNKYFNYKQSLIGKALPNICGVGIFVITADRKILVSKSSKNVIVNPERFIYTASGTMDWHDGQTNPFNDIIRECEEEIGYTPNVENLKLYSFGIDYDTGYYQFSFYEHSDKTAEEIIRNSIMARDFYIEIKEIIAIPFHYKEILDKISEGKWDETAKANLITLIVKFHSRQIVENYINPNKSKENYRTAIIKEWSRRAEREGRFAILSNRYPVLQINQISDDYYKKVITFIDEDLSDTSVLEVGGGIGLFTKYFASCAFHVTCVDVSERMIDRNKAYLGPELSGKVEYVHKFFQDYDTNKHFDILVCSLVLIHNVDALDEIVANMKRLADTIYLFEHIEDGAQVSRFTRPKTKNEYINMFSEYDVEKMEDYMLFTDHIACIKLVRR